jgi:hypothetical protein
MGDFLNKFNNDVDATAAATAATAAAAAADAEKKKFDAITDGNKKDELLALRTPMQKILYEGPDIASQIPVGNFKVHKVKPGSAKGVLGFKNTTIGEDTYTQLVFKPFNQAGNAEIKEEDLKSQPLLNLNGEGDTTGPKERKMTSNMIANIADKSYGSDGNGLNDDGGVNRVKNDWYSKATTAYKDKDGKEVFGTKMDSAKLVGGKSKKRRVQRRKSARRRKMSFRKR